MLEVPLPVVPVVIVPSPTVALESVKVRASSTLAVTVICPAVEEAKVPVSTAVVQLAAE